MITHPRPCGNEHDGLYCTRPVGHIGDHAVRSIDGRIEYDHWSAPDNRRDRPDGPTLTVALPEHLTADEVTRVLVDVLREQNRINRA